MRTLSKINRGAILTAGVLLVVISYLITNAMLQNSEKPVIRQICEAYVQKEISYNMLPTEYRTDKPAMSAVALEKYLTMMKADIIAFYPSNEQFYRFVIQNITGDLTNQSKGSGVVFSYTKTIIRYDEMLFDGDTVDVRFTCNTVMEAQAQGIGSTVKEKTSSETQDNVILQKIDGQWKVVYASINRPMSDNGPGKGREFAVGKY